MGGCDEKSAGFSDQCDLCHAVPRGGDTQSGQDRDDNLLLIEEEHYNKLIQLIEQFEQFQFGKLRLVEVRSQFDNGEDRIEISKTEIQRTIKKNKKTKDKYDTLIMDIGKSFRKQIKG